MLRHFSSIRGAWRGDEQLGSMLMANFLRCSVKTKTTGQHRILEWRRTPDVSGLRSSRAPETA